MRPSGPRSDGSAARAGRRCLCVHPCGSTVRDPCAGSCESPSTCHAVHYSIVMHHITMSSVPGPALHRLFRGLARRGGVRHFFGAAEDSALVRLGDSVAAWLLVREDLGSVELAVCLRLVAET